MISKLRKFRIRVALFLSSHRGKVLFNLFYGMGAAVAILGTLFKLLHLDGANIMLAVGLGTEVFIFALSSLEPPYRNYHWEYVFPILKTHDEKDRPDFQQINANTGSAIQPGTSATISGAQAVHSSPESASHTGTEPLQHLQESTGGRATNTGGTIIIGNIPAGAVLANDGATLTGTVATGTLHTVQSDSTVQNTVSQQTDLSATQSVGFGQAGQAHSPNQPPVYRPHNNPVGNVTPQEAIENYSIPNQVPVSEEDAQTLTESIRKMGDAVTQLNNMADVALITENYISKLSGMADNLNRFSDATGSLAEVSNILLESYRNITENSDNISANSKGYVEQMGNLNRNLMGLNTIYEIQLKSISSQIDTIDRVNNGLVHIREMYENSMGDSDRFNQETEAMAENIARLNRIYARMLEAMSPNAIFANMMAGAVKEESKTSSTSDEGKES